MSAYERASEGSCTHAPSYALVKEGFKDTVPFQSLEPGITSYCESLQDTDLQIIKAQRYHKLRNHENT